MVLGDSVAVLYLLYFLRDRVRYEQLFPGQTAEDGLAVLLLVYTVFAVGTTVLAGVLSDRSGRRRVFVCVAGLLMALPALLLAAWPTWHMTLAAACLLGIGFGVYLSVDQALVTQVLPAADAHAKDMGVVSVASSAGQALAPAVAAPVVTYLGGYRVPFSHCRRDSGTRIDRGLAHTLSTVTRLTVPATAGDRFARLYRMGGRTPDLSNVRIHPTGVDGLCRAFGARALSFGCGIFFRDKAFAPWTREGLWLLAHEVAHVVQHERGSACSAPALSRIAIGGPCDADEAEADAAAEAFVAGRRFDFGAAATHGGCTPRRPVLRRYMAWEHQLLGDLDPAEVTGVAEDLGSSRLAQYCELLARLGRDPENPDLARLQEAHPGLETISLAGSGVVVTLGELSVLPDCVSRPAELETLPRDFILPLIQSTRAWGLRELRRSAGARPTTPDLPLALKYARRRRLPELYEAVDVDVLGRRCGLPPWELYSSVVSRNASHFAPFSWYRWQEFHLEARGLSRRSFDAAGPERERLRAAALLRAGFADHFLHDSFAAGHLINKTLVMQWYVDWLSPSLFPVKDRRRLKSMAYSNQPLISGPDFYRPAYLEAEDRYVPSGGRGLPALTDPQVALEAPTHEGRIGASAVVGATDGERARAYGRYLRFIASSAAQMAAGVAHGHFNKSSLVVASAGRPEAFRIHGDWRLLAAREGAHRAAEAAAASRRAISELLETGATSVRCRDIFELFPAYVETGGRLVSLPDWHDSTLRELCHGDLFGRASTRGMKVVVSMFSRQFGVPAPDYLDQAAPESD
jgi:hypothetical protein